MTQIDGAGQQDTNDQNAEALQAALAQREVTLEAQPQGGSDVPSHQNSDPVIRRIGNSTPPSGSYRKTSCTVVSPTLTHPTRGPCEVTLPHHPVIGSIPLFARRRHRAEGVPLWTEPKRRFGKGATNCQG